MIRVEVRLVAIKSAYFNIYFNTFGNQLKKYTSHLVYKMTSGHKPA